MTATVTEISRKANKNGLKVCQLDDNTLQVELQWGVYARFEIFNNSFCIYDHTLNHLKGTKRKNTTQLKKALA